MLTSSVFLQTSIPNIPSITVLSLPLLSSTRAPLRATLYTGSTRMSVDPVYKVARSGARVEERRGRDRTVIDGILGIDVCKNTLDVSISSHTKVRTQSFRNSPDR